VLNPRAILIDVIEPRADPRTAARRLSELESLTQTYGGIVIVKLFQKRSLPDYQTYIGRGKIDEIIQTAELEKADLLIVNNLLKPKQMFEIGERLRPHRLKAWDRVDLILKIFEKHAKTAEAKLQIKLAALRHMGPRIFGMGMEMMQQTGGIGTRGQGETNTEIMKRHLAEQERQVKKQLERIAQSRANHRMRRDRLGLKTASIVGYTNAGKSSLLNALTKKNAYVANELFATLDTRVGKLRLPPLTHTGDAVLAGDAANTFSRCTSQGTREKCEPWQDPRSEPACVLLSDTIGFIQDLPPQLIDAFRSTLDETIDADLILQVVDAADPFLDEKLNEVETVLRQLDVHLKPRLFVFNKIDLLPPDAQAEMRSRYEFMSPVFVSAVNKLGLAEIETALAKILFP